MSEHNKPESEEQGLEIELFTKLATSEGDGTQFFVCIDRNVYEEIASYAQSDTKRELGGIIIGQVFQNRENYLLVIKGHIVALHTEAMQGSVTFTHDSWTQMHKDKEKSFPDLKIVGWFHTHPGFGIFLSSYDKFIQKNFFNLAWQIAYVVDPVNHRQGFFRLLEDEIVPCEYRILESPGGREERSKMTDPPKVVDDKSKRWTVWVLLATAIALLACSSYLWLNKQNVEAYYASQINSLQQIVNGLKAEMGKKQDIKYIVRSGDTLAGISTSFYGSNTHVQSIAKLNNIKDPNKLYIGQVLLIPVIKEPGGK